MNLYNIDVWHQISVKETDMLHLKKRSLLSLIQSGFDILIDISNVLVANADQSTILSNDKNTIMQIINMVHRWIVAFCLMLLIYCKNVGQSLYAFIGY